MILLLTRIFPLHRCDAGGNTEAGIGRLQHGPRTGSHPSGPPTVRPAAVVASFTLVTSASYSSSPCRWPVKLERSELATKTTSTPSRLATCSTICTPAGCSIIATIMTFSFAAAL